MRLILGTALVMALCSCTGQDQSGPTSSAPKTTVESPPVQRSPEVASPTLKSENGAFELSSVIAFAMANEEKNRDALAITRNYNDFKPFVSDIKHVGREDFPGEFIPATAEWGRRYRGVTQLMVRGKQLIAENLEDDYQWGVYISGPNAGANVLTITSRNAIDYSLEPTGAYFREAGFRLVPLICESLGGGNSHSLYLAFYPGKAPAFLSVRVSSGSGGAFYSFSLFYGNMDWKDVKIGQERRPGGKLPLEFGQCEVADA